MRIYKPSGRVPFFGIIFFVIFGVIAGTILGVAAYFISTLIYLLIVSPLGLAALSGGVSYLAVRVGKFRSPIFGLLAGLILGGFILAVYWGAGYVDLLNQFVNSGPSKNGDIASTINGLINARPALDRNLLRETGQPGILGYVLLVAEDGLSFSRTSSSSSGTEITLNRDMTLGYWGIEALLVLGGAAIAGFRSAKQTFCESRKRWIGQKDYQLVGTVDARASNQFLQVLRSGDYRTAGRYVTLGRSMGLVQVQVAMCSEPDLASPGEMMLRVTRMAGNRTNELIVGSLTNSEYRVLVENAQQRPPLGVYAG